MIAVVNVYFEAAPHCVVMQMDNEEATQGAPSSSCFVEWYGDEPVLPRDFLRSFKCVLFAFLCEDFADLIIRSLVGTLVSWIGTGRDAGSGLESPLYRAVRVLRWFVATWKPLV